MRSFLGKGVYLYVISYIEGGNRNVILPADHPERLAHAERIADAAVAAGLTHVLIKVADGRFPYNVRRRRDDGRVIFNSILPDAIDDCPAVVKALQRRGILVLGWHFIYGTNPAAEAEIALCRMNELGLDGWVVNAEFAHKSYLQNGKIVDGNQVDWSLPLQEVSKPPQTVLAKVGEYMAPVRAETRRLMIWLFLSTYKYPTVHRSFPFAAFLDYCDGGMPQVYPIGEPSSIAHTQQLKRSLAEYREIKADLLIIPTGGAFSEGYTDFNGVRRSWVATVEQVTDFFNASVAEGLPAANLWEWHQARHRFPALWDAMAAIVWPGSAPETLVEEPTQGAGDPGPETLLHRVREVFNTFRIRVRH